MKPKREICGKWWRSMQGLVVCVCSRVNGHPGAHRCRCHRDEEAILEAAIRVANQLPWLTVADQILGGKEPNIRGVQEIILPHLRALVQATARRCAEIIKELPTPDRDEARAAYERDAHQTHYDRYWIGWNDALDRVLGEISEAFHDGPRRRKL